MMRLLHHRNEPGERTCQEEVSSLVETSSGQVPLFPQKIPYQTWNPKVSIIRKELVALTEDTDTAVVLNQLLYWSQRVKDFDQLVEEEKALVPNFQKQDFDLCVHDSPQHGWFYKSAQELIEETLLCVTRVTMRRYLNVLLDRGWIQERANPQNKWDKTNQYRVNLRQLDIDLRAIGYGLPGFSSETDGDPSQIFTFDEKIDENPQKIAMSKNEPPKVQKNGQKLSSEGTNDEDPQKSPMFKNEPSEVQKLSFEGKESLPSNVKNCTFLYLTENTTKNTNREHRAGPHAGEELLEGCDRETPLVPGRVAVLMVDLWRRYVNQEVISLTDERKRRLESLLDLHFQNDLRLWEKHCLRIKASPFLMGEGKRKWLITLDWILSKGNLLRILEGNFDDPEAIEPRSLQKQVNPSRDREKEAILASIKDPTWKNWCSQLAKGLRVNESQILEEPLSLVDLKQIAHAWFIECEDERLLWIGSQDPNVLRKIDDLRLNMTWVFAKDYPKARTLRTRLETSIPQTLIYTGEKHVE